MLSILNESVMNNQSQLNIEEAEARLSKLEGSEVTHAWRGHGSTIFLELGSLSKGDGNSRGEQTIMIEWSWRFEDQSSILLGSFDEDEKIDKFPEMVVGKTIKKVSFFSRLKEVEIQFLDELWLLTFSTNEGDPGWSIRLKNGEWLSASKATLQIEYET